jgi:hypothetical protein
MSKNQTVNGQYTTFNLGSTTLTPRLQEALRVLDRSCQFGSGGEWYIKMIPGGWKATPDGPFDTVYWNGKKGTWKE